MSDDFYVGYLPVPAGQKRFLLRLVPLLLALLVILAVLFSLAQDPPENGSWDLGRPRTIQGNLRTEPYAHLEVADGKQRLLLVTMGKIGGGRFAQNRGEQPVTVTGYPIGREATVLLTLERGAHDIKLSGNLRRMPAPRSLGPATLWGRIIDPKCYFGAMKPGEGKLHKACATLCIRGGIPPMFLTTDPAGERTAYLMVDPDGRGISGEALDTLLPFVADPIRIRGEIEQWGDLLVFKIDTANIERR